MHVPPLSWASPPSGLVGEGIPFSGFGSVHILCCQHLLLAHVWQVYFLPLNLYFSKASRGSEIRGVWQ